MGLFRNPFARPDPEASATYARLRQQVLEVRPEAIGLGRNDGQPIFGIVMETGMGRDVATFVCLADGTVSLYLSTGGGVIGAGQHEAVRSAAEELLAITNAYAADFIGAAAPGLQPRLPSDGQVHFTLLTHSGIHSVACDEKALEAEEDAFASLFSNCHAVLAEVREATDPHDEA